MRSSGWSSRAAVAPERTRAIGARAPEAAAPPVASGRAPPAEFGAALRELGLVGASSTLSGEPLAGGVSSDIWRIDSDAGPLCVKRALPKLRVAADWQAPIERNLYEARWLRVANEAVPGAAPEVLTAEQAAELLQTDAAAVRALADAGELPGRRIGDDWRFLRSAVLAWLGGADAPRPAA
jgi:excisionase family DNA binding protein